jgi:general L-amino acid transport system substrate-binding protein
MTTTKTNRHGWQAGMNRQRTVLTAIMLGAACATIPLQAGVAQTLKQIKDRGVLICGVSQGLIGFSSSDEKGNWSGFDVDFCRALSAAILNDVTKVRYVPLDANSRFTALRSGTIDVLSRNSTWTISREMALGLNFAAVTYYDGQGFLVPKTLKVDTALDLSGKPVCVQSGTTTELNAADYFRTNKMNYSPTTLDSAAEVLKAYDSNRCSVMTSDISQLHGERLKLTRPDDHIILPEIISKEPLGPAVRHGDDQWFNIVKWTHFAMLNAEELGVSTVTIDEALRSQKPDVKRLVGTESDYGEQIGLTKEWVVRIVRLVGNYAEVFERNIGAKSKLAIPRGINELWTNGGIQYAPPIR